MKKLLLFFLVAVVSEVSHTQAASVGPSGYSIDFSTRPAAADWSTRSITGGASGANDSTNAFMVDTNVAAIAASSITNQVLNFDPTNPPAISALASWTSGGGAYLMTRPTGVRLTLLMATLVNNTGSNVDTIRISYTLTIASTNTEEVPGQRMYYSLTGAARSWVNIAAPSVSGPVAATINATWLDQGLLYILIADDNGSGTPDTANEIDDFAVTTSGGGPATAAVSITSPTEGQSIVEQANFAVDAATTGGITNTTFYLDGNPVGSDAAIPYSVIYSNLALGPHTVAVVGNSSVTSAPVHISIVANHAPTVALTTAPGGTVLVGSNIVNTAVVSDSDPGGSIRRVEFYVDNDLTPRVTDTTSPYTFELGDVLAGTHTIYAVAVDQSNARATNSNTLTATNPTDVALIIPNGSIWRYFDKGIDPGGAWPTLLFDDTGWSNGIAELGYGDGGNNRPETTVIGYGTNANTKYITTYFRKTFSVANPGAFTNLIVRLLRDDGGIVYLNGTEVFRSYMTNGVVMSNTLAGPAATGPAAPDDGTFYQVTNIANTLVAGNNVIAVEIHQDAITSTDISFDLMLWGQPSGPRLTVVQVDSTHVDVSWPAPSTGYQLQFKNDLSASAWTQDLDIASPGGDGAWHVTVNISSGKRFFRLEQP